MNRLRFPPADAKILERLIKPAEPKHKYGMTINEGYRVICVGTTGSGKTALMRMVVYGTIDKGYSEYAFIHDAKGPIPEYPKSVQLACVGDFLGRGFRSGDPPVVSFRGDPRRDIECSAEEVAAFTKAWVQRGKEENGIWRPAPILTVIEELAEAASDGQKHLKSSSVRWHAKQGRKVGSSLLGTGQSPAETPLVLLNMATAVVFFRCTGSDANYLGERMKLDPRFVDVIRGPTGTGLPDYKFVLHVAGEEWDGEIHQLDKRTVAMFE